MTDWIRSILSIDIRPILSSMWENTVIWLKYMQWLKSIFIAVGIYSLTIFVNQGLKSLPVKRQSEVRRDCLKRLEKW